LPSVRIGFQPSPHVGPADHIKLVVGLFAVCGARLRFGRQKKRPTKAAQISRERGSIGHHCVATFSTSSTSVNVPLNDGPVPPPKCPTNVPKSSSAFRPMKLPFALMPPKPGEVLAVNLAPGSEFVAQHMPPERVPESKLKEMLTCFVSKFTLAKARPSIGSGAGGSKGAPAPPGRSAPTNTPL
jgi:hypothetical protein